MSILPFDDRDGFIWMDGEMIPWRDAKIHVLNHGLHYASCVFEGERVYNRKVFKLREHTERLIRSAEMLGFTIPYSVEEIEQATLDLIQKMDIVDGYIRPVAWRGSEMMGVAAQAAKPRLAIAIWSWPSYFSPELREKGIRLKTSKWARPAPNTAPTASKAAGLYMICTLSKHDAEAAGYHDALMLDYRGQVAEATAANLFMAKDGKLYTPIPDCFLDGITRQTVIGLAKDRGIELIQRAITVPELMAADEVFLTGTAAEVTAVGEIDGHTYSVGPITRLLRDDYEQLVRK
jgi:branched-chain amino acid aminotransferase